MQKGFKKKVVGISLCVLSISLIIGCGSKQVNQTAAKNEPLKIGVIGAFSGDSIDMGVAMRNGIEMAVEKFNNDGGVKGKKVEIVNYDDEGNPSKATVGVQKLIDSENVVAILGNPNTATAIATAKISRTKQVPQIVPIAQSPEVLDPASPWLFRITTTNPMDIKKIISYVKENGWSRIGLICDTSAYGISGKKILDQEVPAAGLQIVASEGYTVGAPDLTTQALNLKNAKVDVVLMWGLGADEGRFLTNVKKINWNIPVLGGRGTMFKIFSDIGGKAADGTIATAALDYESEKVKSFTNGYDKKYHTVGSIDFAALGNDAANILLEALKKAGQKGDINRQSVRDAIESIDQFKTIAGPEGYAISFAPDKHEGSSVEAVVLVQHKDGKWVALKK